MKNIFDSNETNTVIERINKLDVTTKPSWGKMSADQMLAHCNVTYEMAFEDKHKKAKRIGVSVKHMYRKLDRIHYKLEAILNAT